VAEAAVGRRKAQGASDPDRGATLIWIAAKRHARGDEEEKKARSQSVQRGVGVATNDLDEIGGLSYY